MNKVEFEKGIANILSTVNDDNMSETSCAIYDLTMEARRNGVDDIQEYVDVICDENIPLPRRFLHEIADLAGVQLSIENVY